MPAVGGEGGVLYTKQARGGTYGVGLFALFWGVKVCDKNDKSKIHRGIRLPPDDKEHVTINQINTGKMEKGWGRMSDMEGMHKESK